MGSANVGSTSMPAAPTPTDPFSDLVKRLRGQALMRSARQGLASTDLTGAKPGVALGGTGIGGA